MTDRLPVFPYTNEVWIQRVREAPHLAGISESCPVCYKPISNMPIDEITKKPSCQCGTSLKTSEELLELHGVSHLVYVTAGPQYRRAD